MKQSELSKIIAECIAEEMPKALNESKIIREHFAKEIHPFIQTNLRKISEQNRIEALKCINECGGVSNISRMAANALTINEIKTINENATNKDMYEISQAAIYESFFCGKKALTESKESNLLKEELEEGWFKSIGGGALEWLKKLFNKGGKKAGAEAAETAGGKVAKDKGNRLSNYFRRPNKTISNATERTVNQQNKLRQVAGQSFEQLEKKSQELINALTKRKEATEALMEKQNKVLSKLSEENVTGMLKIKGSLKDIGNLTFKKRGNGSIEIFNKAGKSISTATPKQLQNMLISAKNQNAELTKLVEELVENKKNLSKLSREAAKLGKKEKDAALKGLQDDIKRCQDGITKANVLKSKNAKIMAAISTALGVTVAGTTAGIIGYNAGKKSETNNAMSGKKGNENVIHADDDNAKKTVITNPGNNNNDNKNAADAAAEEAARKAAAEEAARKAAAEEAARKAAAEEAARKATLVDTPEQERQQFKTNAFDRRMLRRAEQGKRINRLDQERARRHAQKQGLNGSYLTTTDANGNQLDGSYGLRDQRKGIAKVGKNTGIDYLEEAIERLIKEEIDKRKKK